MGGIGGLSGGANPPTFVTVISQQRYLKHRALLRLETYYEKIFVEQMCSRIVLRGSRLRSPDFGLEPEKAMNKI